MAVYRNRSTTSVPASLSISYLIGSPPTGTSMITLTSCGGLLPVEMASMRMGGSVIERSRQPNTQSSYADLTRLRGRSRFVEAKARVSIILRNSYSKRMDCRVKPGNDAGGKDTGLQFAQANAILSSDL